MTNQTQETKNEAEQCREWVIFRTSDGEVGWIRGDTWDDYVVNVPDTKCEFLSRGHTLTEAINLTMLANGEDDEI